MAADEVRFVIPGDPIAWQRPRTNGGTFFDGQKKLKVFYGIEIRRIFGELDMLKGPLHLEAFFFYKYPSSFSKKDRLVGPIPKETRPDIDNLEKWILDVAQGILYHDDALIASVYKAKFYDDTSRTQFTLKPIKRPETHEPRF